MSLAPQDVLYTGLYKLPNLGITPSTLKPLQCRQTHIDDLLTSYWSYPPVGSSTRPQPATDYTPPVTSRMSIQTGPDFAALSSPDSDGDCYCAGGASPGAEMGRWALRRCGP